MKASSRIIFFGNERLSTGFKPEGAPTLQALLDNGYPVVAVVANYQVATSRNARELEIQAVARKHNIPVLLPERLADIQEELVALKPTLGVLVAYGRIIPQAIIDIFPRGIVNIHPSLLPAYRGSTPIEQAILEGLAQTGVSLMQLVKAMDAGPVYSQKTLPLKGTESKAELTHQLLTMGGTMLIEHLPAILDGSLVPTAQDENKATYCGLITKEQGGLDFTQPATALERQVRAYLDWPKSRTTLFEQNIIVTQVRVIQSQHDGILVLPCAKNSWLEIQTLIAPSGKRMSGADFMRGYKKT